MRAFFVTSFPVPLLSHFFFVREMITGEGSAPSPSMFAGTSRQGCESVSPRSLPFYPPKFPRNSAQRGAPGHGLWASILWTPSLHFVREKVFLHHAVFRHGLQTFAPPPRRRTRITQNCALLFCGCTLQPTCTPAPCNASEWFRVWILSPVLPVSPRHTMLQGCLPPPRRRTPHACYSSVLMRYLHT